MAVDGFMRSMHGARRWMAAAELKAGLKGVAFFFDRAGLREMLAEALDIEFEAGNLACGQEFARMIEAEIGGDDSADFDEIGDPLAEGRYRERFKAADSIVDWIAAHFHVCGVMAIPIASEATEELARYFERAFQAGKAAFGLDTGSLIEDYSRQHATAG